METAAKYHIAMRCNTNPSKNTGERRTWPNFVSAGRYAWTGIQRPQASDGGNPPERSPIVLYPHDGGPLDFTPGVFNLSLKPYKQHKSRSTALARQLALYVVIYSPVQMACDLLR